MSDINNSEGSSAKMFKSEDNFLFTRDSDKDLL